MSGGDSPLSAMNPRGLREASAQRYVVAVGIITVAAGLQLLYNTSFGLSTPFILLYPAMLICAWYGGLRPGLLAAAVGAVAGALMLNKLSGADPNPTFRVAVFVTTSVLAAALSESLHRARREAAKTSEALRAQLASRVELERARAQHLAATRLMAAIVESSEDAIISKTLDGVVTSWNGAAERLLGYTAAQAVGRHISFIIPPDRLAEEDRILSRLRAGERIDHFETIRLRSDGRLLDVSLTISPIRDEAGRVIGASKIMRDISAQRAAEQRIERLMMDLREADRRKDEFLAMLGHELRNPLSAVRNAVATASLDESRRTRALEIARRQADQLGRLIDDLLDVARITQGQITLRKQRVNIGQIIDRAVESMRPLMTSRRLHVMVSAGSGPLGVDVDPARVEQVLVNLLSNATKFTDPGGRIDVEVQRVGQEAVIRVRDTGAGIAPEMLPRVWDLFSQAERNLDRAQGGLGIGLTVARHITELHGGSIEAHSEGLGRGAEFVLRLPVATHRVDDSGGASSPELSRSAHQARILLVEDNPDVAEGLTMILELLGHHVHIVADGIAALEAAGSKRPEMMLVDIGLPGMDGYEIARRIRQDPALRHVMMVALTGYGSREDKERARVAGFNHHLVKPVNLDLLRELLAQLGTRAAQPATDGH